MSSAERFLREAIRLARDNVRQGGRPFGAVLVKDDKIVASGVNETHLSGDPTAHAELLAIRAAGQALNTPRLEGCTVYASGQPCPMCLAAMHMAKISAVAYAFSNEDGAPFGLSTAAVYAELAKPFAVQSLKIAHVPVELGDEGDPYALWAARTAGP